MTRDEFYADVLRSCSTNGCVCIPTIIVIDDHTAEVEHSEGCPALVPRAPTPFVGR